LIHPTVSPQYTNVTDRQDRQTGQQSDSIGRTVLQTVAQKSLRLPVYCNCALKLYRVRFDFAPNLSSLALNVLAVLADIQPS